MIIYFVRHGETEWNKKEILQGHKDSHLTIKGINNAEKLGKILRDKNIEVIYSSDLGRCIQTAEIINKELKLKIVRTSKLRERNFGDLNGKPNVRVKKALNLKDADEKAPNGESFNNMKKRVVAFIGSLPNKKYKKVLLITHEGPARVILSKYFNTNFNSKKCETSVAVIYSIEANNNKKRLKLINTK